MPQDVDPAFASNGGKERQKNLDSFLQGKLEKIEQNLAQVAVKDMVHSYNFEAIYKGKSKGSVAVWVLPKDRVEQLGVRTRVVQFSQETADKGRLKHADIKQEDYANIQYLMEQGNVLRIERII